MRTFHRESLSNCSRHKNDRVNFTNFLNPTFGGFLMFYKFPYLEDVDDVEVAEVVEADSVVAEAEAVEAEAGIRLVTVTLCLITAPWW
jgi:hypothetical protein